MEPTRNSYDDGQECVNGYRFNLEKCREFQTFFQSLSFFIPLTLARMTSSLDVFLPERILSMLFQTSNSLNLRLQEVHSLLLPSQIPSLRLVETKAKGNNKNLSSTTTSMSLVDHLRLDDGEQRQQKMILGNRFWETTMMKELEERRRKERGRRRFRTGEGRD